VNLKKAGQILSEHPRPWSIEITEGDGRAKDRDGNIVSMFDADDDLEFWTGVVTIVNEHDLLLNQSAGSTAGQHGDVTHECD
jgi:hypothetical protein